MTGNALRDRARAVARPGLARTVAANCSARVMAVAGLTAATVLVARLGGPSDVGAYALLRMIPGLIGVLCVAGLPGALAYFLADRRRGVPRLWPTLLTIAASGGVLGVVVWLLLTPVMVTVFFTGVPPAVVALAAGTVATQLALTIGKTALQGLQQHRAADLVIAAEELAYLPCYLVPVLVGVDEVASIVIGLAGADVVVAVLAWRMVGRHLGWRRLGLAPGAGWRGRPSAPLAREVVTYGLRGQVGGIITLLNLRLDFAILGAISGPAVLGTYAVASKYAELLRLPGTALTWVTYPQLAAVGEGEALRRVRRLMPPATIAVVVAAVPLALFTPAVIALLYGDEFAPAVRPAQVLLVGMLLAGASGLASGYLYGRGRPGLNSIGLGVGLAVTVVLDVLLIPRHGAMGAAIASSAAYLVADALLVWFVLRVRPARPDPASRSWSSTAVAP